MTKFIYIGISTVYFWYFIYILLFYILLTVGCIFRIYSRFIESEKERVLDYVNSEALPGIAIIIPFYNISFEELEKTISNALEVDYPHKQVILVNDGSTGAVMTELIEKFELQEYFDFLGPSNHLNTKPVKTLYLSKNIPELQLVDKENGGKADAANAGINFSRSPYFVLLDDDTMLEKDALLKMIRPFLMNESLVGLGATIRVLNGAKLTRGKVETVDFPKEYLGRLQVIEYLRGFMYGRVGWEMLGGALIISGAFGLFEKKTVVEVGGLSIDTIAEDFELTMKLFDYGKKRKQKKTLLFLPDPVAYTIVPTTQKELSNQRARWHQGLFEVLLKYKHMLLNPRYGLIGILGLPYMWLVELLGPLVEFFGYIVFIFGAFLGFIPLKAMLIFVLLAFGVTSLITLVSILLEGSTFRKYRKYSQMAQLFAFALIENFGFRQVLVFWRLKGFYRFFKKSKQW